MNVGTYGNEREGVNKLKEVDDENGQIGKRQNSLDNPV